MFIHVMPDRRYDLETVRRCLPYPDSSAMLLPIFSENRKTGRHSREPQPFLAEFLDAITV
jgi:hypothetical protein